MGFEPELANKLQLLQTPKCAFTDSSQDVARLQSQFNGKALTLDVPKPKLQEFDTKIGKWKNVNMVKQDPGGPYDLLHNFSENVPPLVNFDEYNPTKNKATIDAFKTSILFSGHYITRKNGNLIKVGILFTLVLKGSLLNTLHPCILCQI